MLNKLIQFTKLNEINTNFGNVFNKKNMPKENGMKNVIISIFNTF